MKKLFPQKAYYEVQEKLGAGLTSDVYSAFRRDSQGWTRQKVALKIIRSKKDVQILKQEFERLSQIRSHYCVRILAWEILGGKPALVLEFIEGVTLQVLVSEGSVGRDVVVEMLAQMKKGLTALHQKEVCHGDLNLGNIMISKSGLIKLIDFGFGCGDSEQLVTPEFASSNRLQGKQPTPEDDWHAFQKICQWFNQNMSFSTPITANEVSRVYASRRRKLAGCVKHKMGQAPLQTRRLVGAKENSMAMKLWVRGLGFTVFFMITLFLPLFFQSPVQYFSIEVRSQNWVHVSVNNMNYGSGSIVKRNLRKGRYHLRWTNAQSQRRFSVQLSEPKTFLLQPQRNPL